MIRASSGVGEVEVSEYLGTDDSSGVKRQKTCGFGGKTSKS